MAAHTTTTSSSSIIMVCDRWLQLPSSLVNLILTHHLNVNDVLKRVLLVCRQWRSVMIDNESFWLHHYHNPLPDVRVPVYDYHQVGSNRTNCTQSISPLFDDGLELSRQSQSLSLTRIYTAMTSTTPSRACGCYWYQRYAVRERFHHRYPHVEKPPVDHGDIHHRNEAIHIGTNDSYHQTHQ
jgi:hypothetical protein